MELTIKTIYITDDDPEDRAFLIYALHSIDQDIKIIEAEDGIGLLEMLHSDLPTKQCLIILDLNMPRMNGLETLSELESIPAFRRLKTVVLTTSDDPGLIAKTKALGALNCFTKPSRLDATLILAHQLISMIDV